MRLAFIPSAGKLLESLRRRRVSFARSLASEVDETSAFLD